MVLQRSEQTRLFVSGIVFTMSFVAVLLTSIGIAAAQDDPLRLVFVNSDPDDGSAVYDEVAGVLDASEDIELVGPTDLLAAGEERGVSLETFRDGDRREKNAGTFKEMLAQTSAESIMVLDVFGGGHTMQLVVIGPRGDELADIRQSIDGTKPSQEESVKALRKVFKVLVPKVRSFRKEEARKKEQSADIDLIGDDEKTEPSAKDRVVREHHESHGSLSAGATSTVGMIFGRRSLQLSTEADYALEHASPFVGASAEIDTIFALMDGDTAAIGATVFGAYAPFKTVFNTSAGPALELPSTFSNVRLDLKYISGVGSNVLLRGKVGAEIMAVTIEENQAYTGSRYTNLRVGAGMTYQAGQLAELELDAAALPTLSANTSRDAMGAADLGVGFHGAARLHMTALEPVGVSVGYDFHYYPANYASPNLDALGGRSASTTDIVQMANVMIGYGF
jgi:hypothetical protein